MNRSSLFLLQSFAPILRSLIHFMDRGVYQNFALMDSTPAADGWSNVLKVYTEVERMTLTLARKREARFHSIYPPTKPGSAAFDDGCGTGVLTVALKLQYPSLPILARDASADMIDLLKARTTNPKWNNLEVRVPDARDLEDIPDDTFAHTFPPS